MQSIPHPQVLLTADRWIYKIHDALRPFYISGRKTVEELITVLTDCFEIRTDGDQRLADLVRIHKDNGMETDLRNVKTWFLKRDERSEIFLQYSYLDFCRERRVVSPTYNVIRYDPGTDEFYSDSLSLVHLLRYLRGIDLADIDNDSMELFPVRYGLSYAANLHALIEEFRTHKGIRTIGKCMQSERLEIKDAKERMIIVKKEDFLPIFGRLFMSHPGAGFDQPLIQDEDTLSLTFLHSDGNTWEMWYRKGLFYTDEYTCFNIMEEL